MHLAVVICDHRKRCRPLASNEHQLHDAASIEAMGAVRLQGAMGPRHLGHLVLLNAGDGECTAAAAAFPSVWKLTVDCAEHLTDALLTGRTSLECFFLDFLTT